MAREIDLTKPLSTEDLHYLAQRDRWHQIARAEGHEDPDRAKREYEAEAFQQTQVSLPPVNPQAPARTLEEVGGVPSGGEGEDEELEPYEEWTFDDLKAELDDRKAEALGSGMNAEDAGKRYSKGGSQKDLVQRLYADDELKAGETQQ